MTIINLVYGFRSNTIDNLMQSYSKINYIKIEWKTEQTDGEHDRIKIETKKNQQQPKIATATVKIKFW